MLPVLLGIGAAISSAITTGEAVVIGAGIGAVGARLLMKNKNQSQIEFDTDDDDELDEVVKQIVRRQLARTGRRTRGRKTKSAA
jgi:uncharacterized membrane-anchored protein YhcB (DUF1043 family)